MRRIPDHKRNNIIASPKIIGLAIIILTAVSTVGSIPFSAAEEEPSRVIGGVDYGNLSIEAALERMVKVDPGINMAMLKADQSYFEITSKKLDVWMPRVGFGAVAVEPVHIFTNLRQPDGVLSGEQIVLDFALDSDSLKRIDMAKKKYETALTEFKEIISNRTVEFLETYGEVAVAQHGLKVCSQVEKEITVLAGQIEKDSGSSGLEKIEIRNYLGLVCQKRLYALNRLKAAQRKLKVLLGLEGQEDLEIVVTTLPEEATQIESFIEKSNLRRVEHIIEVLTNKFELAKISSGIKENPLFRILWSPSGGVGQSSDLHTQIKGISYLQASVFITDFGYTSGLAKAGRTKADIAKLEIIKADEDLEHLELIHNSNLKELNKKIENYRDYIAKTEKVIDFLKKRPAVPVDTLIKINDQLLEARYALKQILNNYLVISSKMTGLELKPSSNRPEFQNLGLEDLLIMTQKRARLTEDEIADKKIKLQQVRWRAEKSGYMPKLTAGASLENDNLDGIPSKTSKAFIAMEGTLLDQRVGYGVEAAQADLKKAEFEREVLRNSKLEDILGNYIMALRLANTLAKLSGVKEIKGAMIEEMKENMQGPSSKYTDADLWPLILQQMELERDMAGLEFSLALAEYNLKKWTGIPLNEDITLRGIDHFGDPEGIGAFLNVVRTKIDPYYETEASVKVALSDFEATKAMESKTTAFEGFSWRLRAETKGADYDGWKDPNTAFIANFTLPWGARDRKLNKVKAARKRIEAQLGYVRAQEGLAENKYLAEARYAASKESLEILKRRATNAADRLKITQDLFDLGARTKRDLTDMKLEALVSQLTYEEVYFDNLYAAAKALLMSETSRPIDGNKEIIVVSSLEEAIDLGLKNRKDLKIRQDALDLEEEALGYHKTFKIDGNLTKDLAHLHSKDPDESQTTQTYVAVGTLDVSLTNKFLAKGQTKRIELADMDLKTESLRVAAEVVGAYTDYLNAIAEYSVIDEECGKERRLLENIENLVKTGAANRADYLGQESIVDGLLQKRAMVKEFCDNYRKRLGIVMGVMRPDFSVADLDVSEATFRGPQPLDAEVIKERSTCELAVARKALLGRMEEELGRNAELKADIVKLDTKAIAEWIKSIPINFGYSYITDYLGERTSADTTFSQYSSLGLNLLADYDSSLLADFFSVNTVLKVYDPTTVPESRMSAIDEKIVALKAQQNLVFVAQKAQQLFDEYKIAVMNYDNLKENISSFEDKARKEFEMAKETGRLSFGGQSDIKQNMLNNNIKTIEAFYRMTRLRNELEQYLRKYTGKGIEDFIAFESK